MLSMNYDAVASRYDRRYDLHDYAGIRTALRSLAPPELRVLELGCGSGHWLSELASLGCVVAGVDPSSQMLARAADAVRGDLRRGYAEDLEWSDETFDVVLAINALHHFATPVAALREAFRVLRRGGSFLSVGLDPHEHRDRWYVYDFFPATLPADLARFPPARAREEWLRSAGFVDVAVRPVERICSAHSLDHATTSGILDPSFTSQLTALTAAEYWAGMQRIHAAARALTGFRLTVDLVLYGTEARRP